MARGDHIKTRRQGYWHHGIDCGDGTVIHYVSDESGFGRLVVRRTAMDVFSRGALVCKVRHAGAAHPTTVLSRAFSRLGDAQYHLLVNNCEHFAQWCVTGRPESAQIRRAARIIGGFTAVAGVAGLLLMGGRLPVRVRIR